MRKLNQILNFSPDNRTITVQAGARWRDIQERVDPANLAVKIMQSYANFTIGGSLSVNAHGRYVGLGPLILSVKSIRVVLADGSLVNAGPTQNAHIFNGVIGGYGGLGLIVEATLELTDNVTVKRYYEASRDTAELEPASRQYSTYMLQEYFIPVDRFDEFIPPLQTILRQHSK